MRHEKVCLLSGHNLDYHCHCPPKAPIKFQENRGTATHGLRVLHTLCGTNLRRMSVQIRALAPIEA